MNFGYLNQTSKSGEISHATPIITSVVDQMEYANPASISSLRCLFQEQFNTRHCLICL
ncbi:MAG: hypothetical protein U0V49_13860 [Saprospiraceae bacterium]